MNICSTPLLSSFALRKAEYKKACAQIHYIWQKNATLTEEWLMATQQFSLQYKTSTIIDYLQHALEQFANCILFYPDSDQGLYVLSSMELLAIENLVLW